MYLGVNANRDSDFSLEEAVRQEQSGAKEVDIFQATGWFRFKAGDNLWRTETDDSQLALTHEYSKWRSAGCKEPLLLRDAINDHEVFSAYDEFSGIYIHQLSGEENSERTGQARRGQGGRNRELFINTDRNDIDVLKTLLHEMQHFVQDIEGMGLGGNEGLFLEIDTFAASRKDNLRKMSGLLNKYPNVEGALLDIKSRFLQLNVYGDGANLDWDAVPDDVADEYFELMDRLSDSEPDVVDMYYDFYDESSRDEPIYGQHRYITPREQYFSLAGEIEANDVSDRIALTKVERAVAVPLSNWRKHSSIKPFVELSRDKLLKDAWVKHTELNRRVVSDISKYSENFSKITLNKNAELDDVLKPVCSAFLVMLSEVAKDLPEDNPVHRDFKSIMTWLGTTPKQFENCCYILRRPFEDSFFKGFVNYLSEDPSHKPLRGVFCTLNEWLRRILNKLEGAIYDADMPLEVKSVYERTFGSNGGIDLESEFQAKIRISIKEATDLSLDSQLSLSALIDAGYESISSRSGICKEDLTEKYNIEFKMAKELNPPEVKNGQINARRNFT